MATEKNSSNNEPIPFSDEQIRSKAYEIWKSRNGGEVSPEDDWKAAIEELKVSRSPFEVIIQLWRTVSNIDNRVFSLDCVKTGISAFGVLATIFAGAGLFLTYQNSQQERQLNTERLVTDRFSKAVEQLGSKDISVRIGGIYALERIAKDSSKDHLTTMEVLTAFIRNSPPKLRDKNTKLSLKISTDIQSAITVIGRRNVDNDPTNYHLDLDSTNLSGANLSNANLSGAHLNKVNLSNAVLADVNFSRALLVDANFTGAFLGGANFTGAQLTNTNFSRAFICRTISPKGITDDRGCPR